MNRGQQLGPKTSSTTAWVGVTLAIGPISAAAWLLSHGGADLELDRNPGPGSDLASPRLALRAINDYEGPQRFYNRLSLMIFADMRPNSKGT